MTKRNRIFEVVREQKVVINEAGNKNTIIDTDIKRRAVIRPAIKRFEKPCPVCKKPMLVSVGQIMKCHKACKKNKWGGKNI